MENLITPEQLHWLHQRGLITQEAYQKLFDLHQEYVLSEDRAW